MSAHTKRAVIVGASKGIGADIARELASNGWQVFACARSVESLLALGAEFPSVTPIPVDFTNEMSVELVFMEAAEKGHIDLIVSTPSIYRHDIPLEKVDISQFRQDNEVNIIGPMIVAKHAKRLLKKQGSGVFVQVSSFGGLPRLVLPGNGQYSAAKNAQTAIAVTMQREFEEEEIAARSFVVCPGSVLTDMITKRLEKHPEQREQAIDPIEVAKFIAELGEYPNDHKSTVYLIDKKKRVRPERLPEVP